MSMVKLARRQMRSVRTGRPQVFKAFGHWYAVSGTLAYRLTSHGAAVRLAHDGS